MDVQWCLSTQVGKWVVGVVAAAELLLEALEQTVLWLGQYFSG